MDCLTLNPIIHAKGSYVSASRQDGNASHQIECCSPFWVEALFSPLWSRLLRGHSFNKRLFCNVQMTFIGLSLCGCFISADVAQTFVLQFSCLSASFSWNISLLKSYTQAGDQFHTDPLPSCRTSTLRVLMNFQAVVHSPSSIFFTRPQYFSRSDQHRQAVYYLNAFLIPMFFLFLNSAAFVD